MKRLIATVSIGTLWVGVASAQAAPETRRTTPTQRSADTTSNSPTNGIGGQGGGRYTFKGQAQSSAVPLADGPGDLNGDGKSDDRAEAAISTTRSNIKRPSIERSGDGNGTGAPIPAKAIISTTRSNIKRPSIEGSGDGNGTGAPIPAKAAINTSRSNIKKPSSLASGTVIGVAPVKPAEAIISTSRSNIKKPQP